MARQAEDLTTMNLTTEDVIRELKSLQKRRPLAQLAAEIGCSRSHLDDIYIGKRRPGPMVLGYLGLERCEVTYRPKNGKRGAQ